VNEAQPQKVRAYGIATEGDWRRHVVGAVRRLDDLAPELTDPEERAALEAAVERFPMAITPYYLSLIDPADPADPIRRMVVPGAREIASTAASSDDPIREREHAPVPGLIRRYPDRALLLVSGSCFAICRHCTRRVLGRGRIAAMDRRQLEAALQYLADHPEIRDVILSGGDPLILETDEIDRILAAVRRVRTVEIVRLATRAPVTLPLRITERLVAALKRYAPLYLITQFNHPREVTREAATALERLADAGIPVLNQSVLLRGVNDSPAIIEQLCRAMVRHRVRPYYLFMCDLVTGTEHFRTPLETGVEIVARLRGRLSGLAIPRLVVDLPGGKGKIPIEPEYVVRRERDHVILCAPDGAEVPYPDPPEPIT
jgi:lysine 2,3-aminomutase